MKLNIRVLLCFFLYVPILWFSVGCDDEAEPVADPEEIDISNFEIIPENPTMKDDISILFYGCSYFQTTSVNIQDNNVTVKKHFNSRLKWPCELTNDTISIGELKKGDYQVTLEIIDLNPLEADSVFYTHSAMLTVSNK